jgi:hypothetical protein
VDRWAGEDEDVEDVDVDDRDGEEAADGAGDRGCAPVLRPLAGGVIAFASAAGLAPQAVRARASAHSSATAPGRTGRSVKRRSRTRAF